MGNSQFLLDASDLNNLKDEINFMMETIKKDSIPIIESLNKASEIAGKLEKIEKNIDHYSEDIASKIEISSISKVNESIDNVGRNINSLTQKYERLLVANIQDHMFATHMYKEKFEGRVAEILSNTEINKIEMRIAKKVYTEMERTQKRYLLGNLDMKEKREITRETIDNWHIQEIYKIVEDNLKKLTASHKRIENQTNILFILYGAIFGFCIGVLFIILL